MFLYMSYHLAIPKYLVTCLPYYRASNSALFLQITTALSFSTDVVLSFSIESSKDEIRNL